MKLALLFLSLIMPFNLSAAESYIVGREWGIPTFREDNVTPLPLHEIDHYAMYRVNCSDGVQTGEVIYPDLFNSLTTSYWISNTPVDCFVMTTIDTDGRTSKYSEIFQATEYDSPNPPACGLTTN